MAHRRGGFSKKIDTVHWTLGSFVETGVASGTPVASTVGAAQHLPETLMRIRGEWIATLNGFQATSIGTGVACGMILVPEGTGTTVLWSPITDGDAPWIWWDTAMLMYEEYVADVTQSVMASSMRRIIDSKAMRKVRNRELQFVAENASLSGFTASDVNVAGQFRVLSGT